MSSSQSIHQSFRDFGKRPATPRGVIERVGELVRKDLERRFKDGFVFDPIIVNPELDHYGDEFLHIYIIFDGDQKKLDPKWTVGMSTRILQQMTEEEMPHTPGRSFIEKSEWKEIYGERIP